MTGTRPKRKYVRASEVVRPVHDCPNCVHARADVDRIVGAAGRALRDAERVIEALAGENARLKEAVELLAAQVGRGQDAAWAARAEG